jgi:thioredoxin-dependent peroxiredoxin
MTRFASLSFFAIFSLLLNPCVFSEPPQDFTLVSPTHDKTIKLSELKGKSVAIHFLLKTECPYCLRYTRNYAKSAEQNPDIVHLFVKPDTSDEIKAWASHLDSKGLKETPAIFRDPEAQLAKAFNIPDGYKFHGESVHYPALIVLDSNGQELFRYVGKNNSDRLSYDDFQKRLAANVKKSK